MTKSPNVRVALEGRPENVALVREILAGLADALDLGGVLEDVKAAVSEAANNVVIHAYGGEAGPMDVDLRVTADQLEVVVRDYGEGIRPRAVDDSFPGRGIGLAVIEALADGVELRAHAPSGVEVAMRFPIPARAELPASAGGEPSAKADSGGGLALTITPAWLSGAILNRVVTGLAARAGFSIDRVSDAQLVADALAAQLDSSLLADRVTVSVEVARGRLAIDVGPFRDGGSESVVDGSAVGDLGPIIERLTDGTSNARRGGGETLSLVMLDRRERG